MATSLVRGRYVVCEAGEDAESSRIISDGAVFQRDGVIEAVGRYDDLKSRYQADEELGGAGTVVCPGLVNTHHHGRGVSTFQMGSTDGCLETWILSGWGRRPADHYLMTLYTAIQMIESGTTTVMYNHPSTPVSGLEDEANEVLRGFAAAGMRTAFSVYFRGQNRVVYEGDDLFMSRLPADLAEGLNSYLAAASLTETDYFQLFESLFGRYHSRPDARVSVLLSPSNVQWVSDEFLSRTKEYAARYQAAVHMHLAESWYQKEYGIRTWGRTPAQHLADIGFLGPELSCAHSVWLTEEDIRLMAEAGSTVCHNPSSNLRLKNGIAPVNAMLAAGVNVAVGTDSTAINDDDDMIQEMRLLAKLHRQPGLEHPAINSHRVLRMATAAAAAPTGFANKIGVLEPGRWADLVVMDLDAMEEPYMEPGTNVVDTILYRGKQGHVDIVMVQGEVVVRGGRFIKMDKSAIVAEMREHLAGPVDAGTEKNRQLAQRLIPFVEEFYGDWRFPADGPQYLYNSRL